MARKDLVYELIKYGLRNDFSNFRKTVEALCAEERALQHIVSATKIDELLKNSQRDIQMLDGEKMSSLIDLYIRNKHSGSIHRVGDDSHDSLWVDGSGTVHYYNLQNGDGCGPNSHHDPDSGYEFMPSEYGELDVYGLNEERL